MSMEKKHWRFPTPFRSFSGKHGPPPKYKVGHSRNRISSVYLSGDTSTNDFIVVPEFDDPVRQAMHEESNHTSHLPKLPAVTPSNSLPPNGVDNRRYDLEPIGFHYNSYLGGSSCNTSVANASWDDDLPQRLGSAYEHIRTMPSATSPKVSLSSDPQMLRKQLGVPQHSVLNYPIQSVPDLPNPYTFRHDSTSPRLSPVDSPDVPHPKVSQKLGLCINTNAYPISPHHAFPDSFWSTRRKSVVAVPTPTEKSPMHCHMPEVPWSARIAGMPRPQLSISNPSKLSKCHVEKPDTSLSSLPSSRRQVLKRASRKPIADTSSLTNAHSWQISLPQIRPPSPFKIDVPLHHTWHDRRTNFNSSPRCHSKITESHETKPRRTSGSTEVLASLAWIGTPPMSSNFYRANRSRHLENPACFRDRLSMAIGVEDDSISDDVLVDRLERVRRVDGLSEHGRDVSLLKPMEGVHFFTPGDENESPRLTSSPPAHDYLADSRNVLLPSPPITQDIISDSDDIAVWQAATKTLLCIREIIRTEKKYQEALKMLLNAQTATPPPPSMVPYISALVRVSEMLLKCFLEDPSAWGVSTALVTSEDELEVAMVSWCAVAGAFFMDGNDPQSSGLIGKWRHRKSGVVSSPFSSVLKQTPISLSPMLPMTNTSSKVRERIYGEYGTQYPQIEQEGRSTFVTSQNAESVNSPDLANRPPSRKASVRDLAIQPIQRVMRYVLLYRDLLDCTPLTSPSRLLVERAFEATARIADHCDRAQRNPAFFHAP